MERRNPSAETTAGKRKLEGKRVRSAKLAGKNSATEVAMTSMEKEIGGKTEATKKRK